MKPDKLTKKEIQLKQQQDLERFKMSSFWTTMGSFLVIMFLKEFLLDKYLINFSIDLLVAVIAFYIALNNARIQHQFIKDYRLSNRAFIFMIFGLLFAILTMVITIKSPFDISFLILVVSHLTSQKIVKGELNL